MQSKEATIDLKKKKKKECQVIMVTKDGIL